MSRILILTIAFLALQVTASLAEDVAVHPETKLGFPLQLQGFERTSASMSSLTASYVVSYQQKDGGDTAVTLYVFSRDGSLEEHFLDMKASLEQLHPKAELLVSKKTEIAGHSGRLCLYKIKTLFETETISEGCLFQIGDHFLKLRMTGAFSEKTRLTNQARSLLDSILRNH